MKSNTTLLSILMIVFFLQLETTQSQNYRTPKAYIEDFEKNETYVKQSLIEYSSSVINGYQESRVQSTLDRIYIKLENINTTIVKNDKGFLGDTSLRDAFLKMNTSTIALLKNKSLRFDDYDNVKSQDFADILMCFTNRKQDIINYYAIILNYTNCKRNFSKKNNITTERYFYKKKLFEYDAHQSLIFFKLNVLSTKLDDLLLTTDCENVNKCVYFLNQVCEESTIDTDIYKKIFVDQSLNNANIELIHFISQEGETLIPLYKDYIQTLSEFKITKDRLNKNNDVPIEKYNQEVRRLNTTKNIFFDNLNSLQSQKKELIDKWYVLKCNFIKRNL
ncbi:hypothetical protein OX283_007310 [Flavobacterium sp. SUN052]|uniref:hypothetical protein n=1 Tax=Flavobacterium sp. SUN052 TaxID=3002441 RepID=UPI00237DE48D|nr:hypothetical protein [Flavobacterium sp. SUN052]MEC4004459.1 hypothetical protein [Flavobacterium sp. SUN052]